MNNQGSVLAVMSRLTGAHPASRQLGNASNAFECSRYFCTPYVSLEITLTFSCFIYILTSCCFGPYFLQSLDSSVIVVTSWSGRFWEANNLLPLPGTGTLDRPARSLVTIPTELFLKSACRCQCLSSGLFQLFS
jgi:hypothetical protein